MNKNLATQILVAAGLITLAVAWRFINSEWALAYNLELVTAASLVAAVFLHRYFAIIVPLVAVFLSDVVIGNSQIALFTWSTKRTKLRRQSLSQLYPATSSRPDLANDAVLFRIDQ